MPRSLPATFYSGYLTHLIALVSLFVSCNLQANEPATPTPVLELTQEEMSQCLSSTVTGADETMTIAQLKEACVKLKELSASSSGDTDGSPAAQPDEKPQGLLDNRFAMEALSRANRFLLTPHKRNYFLPASYHRRPNDAPYLNTDTSLSELNHTEAEMQLSIKILIRENIFDDNGHLYLGYTNHAFWQVYSDHDSAPFRETNHEPEFILSFQNDWKILGFRNALNEIAINHQSNGQGKLLSRSWNRLMLRSVFERGNLVFSLTPWYRLPESKQRYPGDPDGDDNPDILDYMGHFEFNSAYKHKDNIFSLMLRNNFSTNNTTMELGWSFPLSTNLRGYVRYFEGYGHSLIDYNYRQQVFGLGIIFTDLF
ncbi:phospholipase A [Cellvibrio japonicus]|uniref:Phospholipase A1 n=1 Tax=Cellvibrio japonicus (strain Ueda107) TaxID=498211 RepID=B3PBE8_CELJU|nr:phospholipase A [Cellvibrio japonicus]ACE84785.1 putative outer membrane phospholipase A precursor [Cellvibrio japonicus Ueda107]